MISLEEPWHQSDQAGPILGSTVVDTHEANSSQASLVMRCSPKISAELVLSSDHLPSWFNSCLLVEHVDVESCVDGLTARYFTIYVD